MVLSSRFPCKILEHFNTRVGKKEQHSVWVGLPDIWTFSKARCSRERRKGAAMHFIGWKMRCKVSVGETTVSRTQQEDTTTLSRRTWPPRAGFFWHLLWMGTLAFQKFGVMTAKECEARLEHLQSSMATCVLTSKQQWKKVIWSSSGFHRWRNAKPPIKTYSRLQSECVAGWDGARISSLLPQQKIFFPRRSWSY